MRELQGGDFLTGAATGAFSSLAGAVLSAAGANTNDITRAAITIAGGGAVGGITESAMGGNFWNGFKTGLIVAGLNHAAHMAQESIFLKNYKKYLAIVAGESSNNLDEATGIGEVILRRMELKGVTFMNSKFINKIGGVGQFDAIGEKPYNDVMKMSYNEIYSEQKNPYYIRTTGADQAFIFKTNYSNGAYFWNSTAQQYSKTDIGFNWRMYNNGTFQITATLGRSTFFSYADINKHWP